MRTVKIDDINITLLQDEDIARYIKRIYASPEIKTLIQTGKSFDSVKNDSSMLAEFLVQYAIATGDLSSSSISKITKQFLSRQDDYIKLLRSQCDLNTGKSAKQILFEDIVMPTVIDRWEKELKLEHPLKLQDLSKVLSVVKLQSRNNVFHTHSFNSAILQEVEENGLDISKEFFKEELKQFQPIGNQPYKTGVLNTCELSSASFSYASVVPERVKNILSSDLLDERQQKNESVQQYLSRCVDKKLARLESLPEDEKKKLKLSSDKIIDFYYGHQSASIAVIKQTREVERSIPNLDNNIINAIGIYKTKPITSRMFFKLPKEQKMQINDIIKNPNAEDALKKIDEVLLQIKKEHPELEGDVDNLISYIFGSAFCGSALNNFLQSMGDGYDIEGGKIARDKFAIATYQDPAKMFSYYKSLQRAKTSATQEEM